MPDENQVPLWQKLVAIAYLLIAAVLILAFSDRIPADFWPPDSSRVGPNIVAAVVTLLAMTPLAVLLWPPWRRRLHRFVDRKLAPLHNSHAAIHAELHHLRVSHKELHAKLDNLPKAPPPVAVAAVIPVRRARPRKGEKPPESP